MGRPVLTKNNLVIPNELLSDFNDLWKAAYLSYLVNKHKENKKDEFISTLDQASADLGITIYTIRKIKKELKKDGFITFTLKGIPAKDHFMVNEKKIKKYWSI